MKYLAAFALILAFTTFAKAEKIPVHLDCTTASDDFIGTQLCSVLRDKIALSPRYRDSSGDEFRWEINLVSVSGNEYTSSQAVAINFGTATKASTFLVASVFITGSDKVNNQANRIFASFDEQVQSIINAK